MKSKGRKPNRMEIDDSSYLWQKIEEIQCIREEEEQEMNHSEIPETILKSVGLN